MALNLKDLILPYFVIEGENKKEPIQAMPQVYRLSIDNLIKDVQQARKLGVEGVLLFGMARKKDKLGSDAYADDGVVQKAVRQIKQKIKDITVITDVCLCGYATHGHCGILKSRDKVIFDQEKTRKILARIALSHAQAGADVVAPSAMMNGQVKVIRETLDKNGLRKVKILAYSAKFASNFYRPFREALDSAPRFGDRSSYQLDFRNTQAALREIKQDIQEGADIVMVKPALAYLDIIYQAKQEFGVPIAAYNVSGEYALVKAQQPEKELVLEVLNSIKRAGADLIISYHTKKVAEWLRH